MPSLSKILSRSGESKEQEALKKASISAEEAPPPYTEHTIDDEDRVGPADLTAGFSSLRLDSVHKNDIPRSEECTAHLKLLECFYRLRQKIGSSDGLFGLSDSITQVTPGTIISEEELNRKRAVISEKRWQVYVSRAVLRFERWRDSLEPQCHYFRIEDMTTSRMDEAIKMTKTPQTKQRAVRLPPLDILMVWHAYMLNPRDYLEDCVRQGRMSLWHCPMPWQSVADCISNDDFQYRPSSDIVETFETETGLRWDNIDDSSDATVICAHCFSPCSVPWTTCGSLSSNEKLAGQPQSPMSLADKLSQGTGYADKEFLMQCSKCTLVSDHDALCVGKFLRDVTRLLDEGALMPGTLLNRKGLLEKPWKEQDPSHLCTFPSRLLDAGLGKDILIYCKGADNLQMAKVRAYIEEGLKDKKLMQKARNSPAWRMLRDERVSVRRMMSRYWENSSPFGLDLVGAVTRQGSFIEKMHDIDWLHSPALPGTMKRLVIKYTRFVTIMKDPMNMAVPTLDVDLAWHTHQLNPLSYLEYTVQQTGQFVDHDDKVAETKLTDAFAWTSKTYQKLFNEPYSECTCWYCEAIRESHTSSASRIFRTSSAAVSDSLHQEPKDPRKSVHISAHNAVRPTDGRGLYKHYANVKANELEKHYQKACARAEKKGRPKPRRDDYYYSDAWGYPLYLPAMMPYYGMGMYNPGMYPVNPGCMALGAGAVGNCCSGTCGGTVAAGGAACAGGASSAACGGGVGGTVGACGGGSGFTGGGNCGGGGGGGCGGGGGGGGCGGGGGGC